MENKPSSIPYAEIFSLYDTILVNRIDDKKTSFSKCRPSNNHRKQIKARWNDQLNSLKDWGIFFNLIFYSDFLCCRKTCGFSEFKYSNFSWITKARNCDKILDEYYHNQ